MASTAVTTNYDDSVPLEALETIAESDYTSGTSTSDTQSVTDSIRDYTYENGRRYHRYGGSEYALPNDETEQDRLDLLLLLDGKLHTAPLPEKVHRVLDCGTGTGIWALDFGETHPETEVLGVDISPIQPSWVYPNVKFEVDNLDQEWTWKDARFDFIHARHIFDGITNQDGFIKTAFKHLAPGGWLEISEWEHNFQAQDGSYGPESVFYQFMAEYQRCAALAGQKVTKFVEPTVERLKDADFVDIKVQKFLAPLEDTNDHSGAWPKEKRLRNVGQYVAEASKAGIEAYSLAVLTKFGGLTAEQAKQWGADAMKEVFTRKIHVFYYQYQIIGRKPE